MTISHWLIVFGVPRTTCSDHGPKFTDGWFKAMCAYMRIRHARSVTCLIRSNCRAEVAGSQLFERLGRIHLIKKRRNWFD